MAHTQFQQRGWPPSVIKGCRAPVATARPSRPAAHHPSPLSSTQATQCQATAHCLLQPGSWPRTGFHLVLGSPARCTCTSTGPSALPTRCRQHQAHRRVPCRSAAREQDRFGVLDSLDSLDSILGQQQATQTQEPQLTNAEVAFTKSEWKTLNKAGIYRLQDQVDVPRVPPMFSFIFYYWHLVLFMAVQYYNTIEGPGAGEDFAAGLVNDHAATLLSGEFTRVLTSPFVHQSPWALIVALLALGYMAADVEAYVGYWAFLALCVLTSVSTGLVEARIDDFPITQGSLPVIAGLVAALLVSQARSLRFDLLVDEARDSPPTNRGRNRSPTPTSPTAATNNLTTASTSTRTDSVTAQQQQRAGSPPSTSQRSSHMRSSRTKSRETETETKIEFFEGLFSVDIPTSAKVQAAVALATASLSSLEALYDLQVDGGGLTSTWPGIFTGLATGCVVGWGVAPVWTVKRVPYTVAYNALNRLKLFWARIAIILGRSAPWQEQDALLSSANPSGSQQSQSNTSSTGQQQQGNSGQGVSGQQSGGSSIDPALLALLAQQPDVLLVRDVNPVQSKLATALVVAGACVALYMMPVTDV